MFLDGCSSINNKKHKMNQEIIFYDKDNLPSQAERNLISEFLFTQLGKYGDTLSDINKCMDYSLSLNGKPGGFITALKENGELVCSVVINKTGMEGYIPENILVYIATHENQRGKGVGKAAMNAVIEKADGAIALHVEPDNPAKFLYEKLGFTNKYLEMRYQPKS